MNVEGLKRRIVGTELGRALLRSSDWNRIWRAVRGNPEKLAMISQDMLGVALLPQLCRSSACFLDVGAHIGSVIASVQARSTEIEVIAIEAIPAKAAALEKKFPHVQIHSCAVGERTDEVSFFVDLKRGGFSSLARAGRAEADVEEICVPMRRIDDLVHPAAIVDVIKIDVEGAELGALRGSEELVSRCRPAIYFESGVEEQMGYSHEALFKWFAERDYQVFVPNRVAHDGFPLGSEGFLEAHQYPVRTQNYFALAAERRAEFRDRARAFLGILPRD